jgi:hypothetical protein
MLLADASEAHKIVVEKLPQSVALQLATTYPTFGVTTSDW